ncbi:MAG: alpha-L-fucosidase C-terminal domain-containing protein, partial [Rhizomicrobium sp.]
NGEAIHGTRPWHSYGEGPTVAAAGAFKETANYTAQDIRFTTKPGVLYAITLGTPTGQVRIASLGTSSPQANPAIKSVQILGQDAPLRWRQQSDALVVDVPAQLPTAHASAFKIALTI